MRDLFLFYGKVPFSCYKKYGEWKCMKKSILIISILSILLFSGCNKTISLNNCISDIKEKVVKEFKSASKSSSEKLNKKIATINKAIAYKDEEIIYDLMADDLKEHGDKLRIQLKEFVNYVPGEIVDTSNRDWGTLKHTEKYKKAPDNAIERKIWDHDDEGNYYCGVLVYRLSYQAIDDQGIGYEITMEYIESNEANPEEVGLNYVSIYKTDSDDDELVEVGRTWR